MLICAYSFGNEFIFRCIAGKMMMLIVQERSVERVRVGNGWWKCCCFFCYFYSNFYPWPTLIQTVFFIVFVVDSANPLCWWLDFIIIVDFVHLNSLAHFTHPIKKFLKRNIIVFLHGICAGWGKYFCSICTNLNSLLNDKNNTIVARLFLYRLTSPALSILCGCKYFFFWCCCWA